jgi:uncharacterized protein (TIGR02266 family)
MRRERRHFHRIPHAFEVQYRRQGELGESWRAVNTVNLSAGGIRIRCEDLFEGGTLLELSIQLPNAREPLVLQGCVIWSRTQASGVTEYGVEFLDVTPERRVQIDNLVEFLKKSL